MGRRKWFAGRPDKAMLSAEHKELLSAFLDGEATGAEAALANALLLRPDARAYHDGLARVRDLLGRYGGLPVVVPAGFSRGVLDAIASIPGRVAPIRQLPLARSFNPWVAAAAGLVLATTLFAASAMFSPAAGGNGVSSSVVRIKESPATFISRSDAAMQPPRPAAPPSIGPAAATEPLFPVMDNSVSGKALRLKDDKLELNLHINREGDVDSRKVYGDVLRVSALFGAAQLKRSAEAADGSGTDGADSGKIRDFSTDDYVEIEVDDANMPGLLGALGRLAANEDYGRLVLPDHLRTEVVKFAEIVARADAKKVEGDVANPSTPAEMIETANLPFWEQMDKALKNNTPKERQVIQERLQRFADAHKAQLPQNDEETAPGQSHILRRKVFVRLR